MSVTLYQGDCLHELERVADGSVNLILGDLPYGTTACAWDCPIDLTALWKHFKRILTPNGAIVCTAAQPFTSALVMSNPTWFRYDWTWEKSRPTGHLDANRKPMKAHESVLVFYRRQPTFNPQMWEGPPAHGGGNVSGRQYNKVYREIAAINNQKKYTRQKYPRSVLRFPSTLPTRHNTEKPLALMEYLIRTYSNPGDVVCDPTMGSGTTGEAAINLDRAFIGCELDPGYFATAQARIVAAQARARQLPLEAAS